MLFLSCISDECKQSYKTHNVAKIMFYLSSNCCLTFVNLYHHFGEDIFGEVFVSADRLKWAVFIDKGRREGRATPTDLLKCLSLSFSSAYCTKSSSFVNSLRSLLYLHFDLRQDFIVGIVELFFWITLFGPFNIYSILIKVFSSNPTYIYCNLMAFVQILQLHSEVMKRGFIKTVLGVLSYQTFLLVCFYEGLQNR